MLIDACPPATDLERLFLGSLGKNEADVLEQHVLSCGPCLENLKKLFEARDTLTGVLSGDTISNEFCGSPVVTDLIGKLKSMRPAAAMSAKRGPSMIAITCCACQKKLSVHENAAGKKVRCPGCGQLTAVPAPAQAAVGGHEEMWTVPFVLGLEQATTTPSQVAVGDNPTHPSANKPDSTITNETPEDGHDLSLTDFLAPPEADDELGRLGEYRILKVLGHGGMGVVYQAEDPKLKRSVAIKAMLPALAVSASSGKRFLREAQAMAAVEHDHIVRIYRVAEDRGIPFMAMEFLKGETLDARLKRDQQLPLAEVLRIGREVAEALAAAHATGLIHRDIKPANIWLESHRNRVKILDFGLARAAAQESGLTQQGAIVGTPAYMSPEQARGDTVDARSDLFSLGVVLYRMSTGKQPFVGKDTVSTLMQVAMHAPPSPVMINFELPQELSDLVMKLLEKDSAKRIASAGELVAALQSMEDELRRQKALEEKTLAVKPDDKEGKLTRRPGDTVTADPDRRAEPRKGPGEGASQPRRKKPLALAAVLLGVLFILAAGVFGIIRISTPEGDFVIDTDDPDFFFSVSKGAVVLKDEKLKRTYILKVLKQKSGEYELEVTDPGNDLAFNTKTFTIKRGEKVALKAWFERKGVEVAKGRRVDDAWIKMVAALPAEKQVEAVADKLKDLNPGFDGTIRDHQIKDGVVTELEFHADKVTDISPVRALSGLRVLRCYGKHEKAQLADLSPLRDMKLTSLRCSNSRVSDLAPLTAMKLASLGCTFTLVADLSPLKDMNLASLYCSGTQVSDLLPLKDMKLNTVWCDAARVSDLSPLRGMPLKELRCDFNLKRDAEILHSIPTLKTINDKPAAEVLNGALPMPVAPVKTPLDPAWLKLVAALPAKEQAKAVADELQKRNPGFDGQVTPTIHGNVVLYLSFTTENVADISPVRALPGLRTLSCFTNLEKGQAKGQLADLSPLKDMKLTIFNCQGTKVSDLSALKGMPLTNLNCSYTQVSDLSPLKDMKLMGLRCSFTPVSDLSPLKSMPLTSLICSFTKVSDLSPLKDMKLKTLDCRWTKVSDLSPLKGVPLTNLSCDGTQVTDLSPLKGMPLSHLKCGFEPKRDAEILRSITTLEKINGKPAGEVLKGAGQGTK